MSGSSRIDAIKTPKVNRLVIRVGSCDIKLRLHIGLWSVIQGMHTVELRDQKLPGMQCYANWQLPADNHSCTFFLWALLQPLGTHGESLFLLSVCVLCMFEGSLGPDVYKIEISVRPFAVPWERLEERMIVGWVITKRVTFSWGWVLTKQVTFSWGWVLTKQVTFSWGG